MSDEKDSEMNFDELIKDIIKNPEIILTSDLTPEQLLEIQRRINPYGSIGGPPASDEIKRIAAVSCTNLKEDYIRRFTVTSLVGYMFQMLNEWEVSAETRRWTPPKAKNQQSEPFDYNTLVEQLETSLAIARDAKSAHDTSSQLKALAIEMDAVAENTDADRKAVAEKYSEAELAVTSAVGLLYAATHSVYKLGSDAATRLLPTANLGMQYPEVSSIISNFPLPPAHGQMEMPMAVAKNIITTFMKNCLEFDPSIHVRSGHDSKKLSAAVKQVFIANRNVEVDTKDPEHLTISNLKSVGSPIAEHKDTLSVITASKQSRDAVIAVLRDEDLADATIFAIQHREEFKQYLFPIDVGTPTRLAAEIIPSQDMFHRWAYYTEVNFEDLRTITEAVYPERPDIDWALALWDVFEGTQNEVDEAFQKHCLRYQDEVTSSIKSVGFGHWTLLADFKENRKKIQFYNKNTEVLKRILDRHAEDKKMGAELMRNRVRQTKAKNIAESGADDPGLAKYKQNISSTNNDLASKGAEKVITTEEMRRLERANGSIKAARELELLEQLEKTINDLSNIKKYRELSLEESRDLQHAQENIVMAREMVSVPDDAIQIDVFSSNPTTGEFGKSHFYTKADTGEEVSDRKR